MQIERSPVDLGAAADVRHRHLREADLGQQREERLLYDREGVAPPAVDLGFSHRLSNLSRLTMSSSCSFIDRCTRLFIAPAKINKDIVYRHLFIIAEREYQVTLYEQLVIELTNRSFSHQAVYRNGGTSYDLSDCEPAACKQDIEAFARKVEEADCVFTGEAGRQAL